MSDTKRFIAEWIERDHLDPVTGYIDLDRTEYGNQVCRSYGEAEHIATAYAERAGVQPEWFCIKEQEYTKAPWSIDGWETVNRWVEGVLG